MPLPLSSKSPEVAVILALSVLLVFATKSAASVVPIKLVVDVVPALPVTSQASLPISVWAFILRTVLSECHSKILSVVSPFGGVNNLSVLVLVCACKLNTKKLKIAVKSKLCLGLGLFKRFLPPPLHFFVIYTFSFKGVGL